MEREIHNIGLIVKCLDNTIMRRALDDIPEEERLPVMQGWIIKYLHDNQRADVFQKDIEKDFHIARSTVTSLVKQMEGEGYIARVGVERDSRLKKIILLEKGKISMTVLQKISVIWKGVWCRGFPTKSWNGFCRCPGRFSIIWAVVNARLPWCLVRKK